MNFGEYNDLYEFIKSRLMFLGINSDDGHAEDHIYRVFKNAMYIQQFEGGNKDVLAVSSILHDLHRWVRNKANEFISPKPVKKELKKKQEQVNK